MNHKSLWVSIFGLVVVLGLGFVGGMFWQANNQLEAGTVTFLAPGQSLAAPVDLTPFWKVWQLVDQKYVAVSSASTSTPQKTDQDKLYGALAGLVDSLGDPYSIFLTPEENKAFTEEIQGNFSGVGMEIGVRNNAITVIAPLPDTPAKKAGLQSGDKIVAIDGQSTSKLSVDETIKLIRGEAGTSVTISVLRGEKTPPIDFKLKRAVIKVPVIESKNLPGGVTQIKLFSFTSGADDAFAEAVKTFAASTNKYLILDLRGNPGGYLDSAVKVASWFLPKGTPVVIEQHDQASETKIYPSLGYQLFSKKPKLVILVDGGSASASEIVAGALQENGVAKLVGEQTFGKGSVQELFPITKDTALKLTIARWLTPHGLSISQSGLKPDYEIKPDEKNPAADLQLKKAIEVVKSL